MSVKPSKDIILETLAFIIAWRVEECILICRSVAMYVANVCIVNNVGSVQYLEKVKTSVCVARVIRLRSHLRQEKAIEVLGLIYGVLCLCSVIRFYKSS